MINAKITGVGGYVPEKVYDNAYMESLQVKNRVLSQQTSVQTAQAVTL